ncbi:MAG: peroxiredoxin family protein [Actinomycetota bacterium]|nr:peroxiredoxin family protein [Actinomycetota bacterium]
MVEQRSENEDQAPDFSLLAAGSGRRVTLRGNDGRPVVLIFHLQGTAPTAREINRAIRERYPDHDEVLVASVIDLSIVPAVYWMTVGLVLGQAYEQAASKLPSDTDAADYIVILPDWSGRVSRAYGVRRTNRAAAIVIIDRDSNIAGSYQGERPVEAVLEILERVS